eukprot:scaffold13632_cov76-Phaeocystis_antarctica.AAC.1
MASARATPATCGSVRENPPSGQMPRTRLPCSNACRVAATDDGAVHRAHERHGQRSQRREACEGVTQRGSGSDKRRATLVRIWVAARREVRAGAS